MNTLGMKLDKNTLIRIEIKANMVKCPYCSKIFKVHSFEINADCGHVMEVSQDKKGEYVKFGKLIK